MTFSAAVAPETVTVGDRFVSHLRASVPKGSRVQFGSFSSGDSIQLLDSIPRVNGGGSGFRAAYPLVAWRAGEPLRQLVQVRVTLPDSTVLSFRLALALPVVRSVLPREDSISPRPARGLIETGVRPSSRRGWLPLLIAGILGAAVIAWYVWSRRRSPAGIAGDPREHALSRLDHLHARRPLPLPEAVYTEVSRIMREYLASLDPRWSEDLTTSELLGREGEQGSPPIDWAGLEQLMRQAEPVKFAGATPPERASMEFIATARQWVAENPASAIEREAA